MAESTTNSITLSPDLTTLYLIDNGRAIPFNLISKLGIEIGTLNGQLTVTTALPDVTPAEPDEPETPDQPEGPDDDKELDEGSAMRLFRRPIPIQKVLRLSTSNYHWNFLYIKDRTILSIIGATDIDTSIIGATDIDTSIIGATDIDTSLAGPAFPVSREIIGATDIDTSVRSRAETPANPCICKVFSFVLANKTIRMRRVGDVLHIYF